MKKIIFLIITLIISSCKKENNVPIIFNSYEKNKAYCDKIVIISQDTISGYSEKRIWKCPKFAPNNFDEIFVTDKDSILSKFNKILKKGKREGYCCCPQRHYEISFYHKNNKFDSYSIDTLQTKNKVFIYENSYQFGYLIDKDIWKNLLNSFDKPAKKQFIFLDKNKARDVFNQFKKKNFTIIESNEIPENWIKYDGDFKATIKSNGKNVSDTLLIQMLKDKYSNDAFEIEIINESHSKSENSKYIFSTFNVNISSSYIFYKNFNIFSTKKGKYYDSYGEFFIIGDLEEIKKMEEKISK